VKEFGGNFVLVSGSDKFLTDIDRASEGSVHATRLFSEYNRTLIQLAHQVM